MKYSAGGKHFTSGDMTSPLLPRNNMDFDITALNDIVQSILLIFISAGKLKKKPTQK